LQWQRNLPVAAHVANSNRKQLLSLEERKRLYEGSDQLELWPTEKSPWPRYVGISLVLILVVSLLFVSMIS
jgi:hypothetical protein